MIKSLKILCCIALLGFVCGCKKDPPVTPNIPPACDPIPPDPPFGYMFVHYARSQEAPCFDPCNSNQICFILDSILPNQSQRYFLCKYDFSLNSKTILDFDILSQPQINKQGWIVYGKLDWNIYKIKLTGDSLTQLTFDGQSFSPSWSPDGKRILFNKSTGSANSSIGYVVDPDGNITDSLKFIAGSRSIWYKQNQILFIHWVGNNLCYKTRDLISGSEKIIRTEDSNEGSTPCFIDTTSNILYYSVSILDNSYTGRKGGFYSINLTTLETKQIFLNCRRDNYGDASMSSTGKIIAQRNILYPLDAQRLYSEADLYLFNSDGSNLQKLNIP